MSDVNIQLLVEQAKRGSLPAFEELVSLHEKKIYALALRLTGHPDDAEDLAQEVFLRAFQALKDFRGEANFATWLHRITVNLWHDELRRRGPLHKNVVSLEQPANAQGDNEATRLLDLIPDPRTPYDEMLLLEAVWQGLQELSEEYRTILVLREMEDCSYEELARLLGCSMGTVKSRLNRARQALQQQLMKSGLLDGVRAAATARSESAKAASKAPVGAPPELRRTARPKESSP